MTVALVGVGGYGDIYVNALLAEPMRDVQFVAGVDPAAHRCHNLPRLQARGVPIFASLAAMYAAGVRPRLVILATPLHLHADQAVFAMEHGSDVLCEKPLAATLEDAARMIAARDRTGRHLTVGYQWAYAPGIRALKNDILKGRFGQALRMRTRVYWPRDAAYYARNGWAGRIATADGRAVFDSPVNNACAHFLHNMLYLLGPTEQTADWPAAVSAELYRAHPIENYDTAVLRCQTRGGVELFAAVSHATQTTLEPEFEYAFARGTVASNLTTKHHVVATTLDGETIDYGPQPMGSDASKLGWTIAAIRDGRLPACPAEAAAAHTALTLAVQRAAEVIPFPTAVVRTIDQPGKRGVAVVGLEGVLDQCFESRRLPSELGVAWAVPGHAVQASGAEAVEIPCNSGPMLVPAEIPIALEVVLPEPAFAGHSALQAQ